MSGPGATVLVGQPARQFSIPKRMLLYHSPVTTYFLPKKSTQLPPNTLTLPDSDTHAFFHVQRWMQQNRLCILPDANIDTGLVDACTLLCRTFAIARDLEIDAMQPLILKDLQTAFKMARDAGLNTPLTPSTVVEV